ncbi:hypothetical protein WA158_001619 [Blastocystis sp. Blastoise]
MLAVVRQTSSVIKSSYRIGYRGMSTFQTYLEKKSGGNKAVLYCPTHLPEITNRKIVDELPIQDYYNGSLSEIKLYRPSTYKDTAAWMTARKTLSTLTVNEIKQIASDLFVPILSAFVKQKFNDIRPISSAKVVGELKDKLRNNPNGQIQIKKSIYYIGREINYLSAVPELLRLRVSVYNKDIKYLQATVGLQYIQSLAAYNFKGFPVSVPKEFINYENLPCVGGKELPLSDYKREWLESKDSNNNTYYYNPITKESRWNNPNDIYNSLQDDQLLRMKSHWKYVCVIEKPLLLTVGEWKIVKIY